MKRLAGLALTLAFGMPARAETVLSAQGLLALAAAGDHPATTIEELLGKLPESYRRSFVLVYDSRSLQAATPDAPRVILYGDDASFLVAFNGDPSESNFDQLEIMQQNPATKDFELYAMSFPGGRPTLSGKNPPLCLSCHRSDPRPNWEPYPVWPGVYGSVHNGSSSGPVNEDAALARFVAGPGKEGRYAQLVGLAERYTPTEDRPVSTNNDDFTTILAQRNFDRIVVRLMASPDYAKYRYALLASVASGCPDVTTFLPDAVRARLGDFAAVRREADAADAKLKAQEGEFSGDAEFFPEGPTQAALRYLVEPRGLDTSSWSLSLDPGIQSFGTGQFGIWDMNLAFYRNDPELRPFMDASDPVFGQRCEELRKESLAALGGKEMRPIFAAPPAPGTARTPE